VGDKLRTVVLVGALQIAGCALLTDSAPPEECWFLEGQPFRFEAAATLRDLDMAPPSGKYDALRVRAWITAEPVDLWRTGEFTKAICTQVIADGMPLTKEFIEQMGSDIGWNSWPPGQVPTRGGDDG
jgi:hypothetical protein